MVIIQWQSVKNIIIINICAPNIRALEYIKQILIEQEGKITNIIIVAFFDVWQWVDDPD